MRGFHAHPVTLGSKRNKNNEALSDAGEAIAARDVVDKLLASLSPEDRSLILMVDLEGRSMQEISDLTGWSVSKIKMRLFRVRPQLRQMIHKLEE